MKLYHVTKDLNHDGHFTPRIPQCRYHLEDETIPRICFSASIEGALSALPVPKGGSFGYLNEVGGCVWKVFEVETDTLDPQVIQTPQQLYESGLVLDTWMTEEYWITTPLDLSESSYLILIHEWELLEMGLEDQEEVIEALGWNFREEDRFAPSEYKVTVGLESGYLGVYPHSFTGEPLEMWLSFDYFSVKEEFPKLQQFCEQAAGLSLDLDWLKEEGIVIQIEDNQVFQSLCRFIGTEWVDWEALKEQYDQSLPDSHRFGC